MEAAAEIYDLCQEDIMQYYPKICRQDVSIHVIQSGEHILNTVSRKVGHDRSLVPQLCVPVLRGDFEICRGRPCFSVFLFQMGEHKDQDKFARDGVELVTEAR